MDYILAAFLSLVTVVACFAIAMSIGAHVVKKYPNQHDPDRSARRYVVPAAIASALGFVALIALIVFVILAIVT